MVVMKALLWVAQLVSKMAGQMVKKTVETLVYRSAANSEVQMVEYSDGSRVE